MPRGTDLSLTEWVVLGLVVEEPRHGFAVARELAADGSLGQVWTVPRPLVYRAVEHLRVLGLVEPVRTEPGAQGPRRTVFRASRAGRARLGRWLDRPVAHPRDVRTELLAKLVLRARRGLPLHRLAERQLEQFALPTDRLARAARDAVGAERVVARWRVETMRAIRRTLEAVVADETATRGATGR